MADSQARDRVNDAFEYLFNAGKIHTKRQVIQDLAKTDSRKYNGGESIFEDVYALAVDKSSSKKITLGELFGDENPETKNRTVSRFYAINDKHERRSSKHLTKDQWAYVAQKLREQAKTSQHEAETADIARTMATS